MVKKVKENKNSENNSTMMMDNDKSYKKLKKKEK